MLQSTLCPVGIAIAKRLNPSLRGCPSHGGNESLFPSSSASQFCLSQFVSSILFYRFRSRVIQPTPYDKRQAKPQLSWRQVCLVRCRMNSTSDNKPIAASLAATRPAPPFG